jgi:omega-amidase
VALIQHLVRYRNKPENLRIIRERLIQVKKGGSDIVILPECFNSEYSSSKFRENAEIYMALNDESSRKSGDFQPSEQDSPSIAMLREMSKQLGIYIIGGSVPELDPSTNRIYNTCYVFNRQGSVIGKHRKVHNTRRHILNAHV